MATPAYLPLKNGVSFYPFPSASEDMGSSFQNDQLRLWFSHFALLNIPTQHLSNPDILDFEQTFKTNSREGNKDSDTSFASRLIESLRNYVANADETIRSARTGPNENYYDQNVLKTPAERIFWRWLKSLGALKFQVADGPREITSGADATENYGSDWRWDLPTEHDDTASTLTRSTKGNADLYKRGYWHEVWWKERNITVSTVSIKSNGEYLNISISSLNSNWLAVRINERSQTFNGFKKDDYVSFRGKLLDIHLPGNPAYIPTHPGAPILGNDDQNPDTLHRIMQITRDGDGWTLHLLVEDMNTISADWSQMRPYCKDDQPLRAQLYYSRLVQYVGEISNVNNVEVNNKNLTQIMAYVPEQSGQTPKVLFRTVSDRNWRPGLAFPMIPQQWEKREIQGAESSSYPMNTNSSLYPGNIWAQFDRVDTSNSKWQYTISAGDAEKRTGPFYGAAYYDRNGNPISAPGDSSDWQIKYDSSNIDGLCIDFNTYRYSQMHRVLPDRPQESANTFDEFSAVPIDGQAPKTFEFNAILWYYTIEDAITGEQTQNLYGVSFLDHPNNSCDPETVKEIPRYKKIAPGTDQSPTAFNFSNNIEYVLSADKSIIQYYDPTAGHNLRDTSIFNRAITQLTQFNDLFAQMVSEHTALKEQVESIVGLIYTQQEFLDIERRFEYLEGLLSLYKTLQIGTSNTITPEIDVSVSPPLVRLHTISPQYGKQTTIKVSNLFDQQLLISTEYSLVVARGVSHSVSVQNDDQIDGTLRNNTELIISLDRDLTPGQLVSFYIDPYSGSQNKKLSIRLKDPALPANATDPWYYLAKNIDLPIDINPSYVASNAPVNANDKDKAGIVLKYPLTPDLVYADIHSIWIDASPEAELIVVLNKRSNYVIGDYASLQGFNFKTNAQTPVSHTLDGQVRITNVISNTLDQQSSKGTIDVRLNTDPASTDAYKIRNSLEVLGASNLPSAVYTCFPKDAQLISFDYTGNAAYETLIEQIRQTKNGNTKYLPSKLRVDNPEINWGGTGLHIFTGNPLIRIPKKYVIDILKMQSTIFSESFKISYMY